MFKTTALGRVIIEKWKYLKANLTKIVTTFINYKWITYYKNNININTVPIKNFLKATFKFLLIASFLIAIFFILITSLQKILKVFRPIESTSIFDNKTKETIKKEDKSTQTNDLDIDDDDDAYI